MKKPPKVKLKTFDAFKERGLKVLDTRIGTPVVSLSRKVYSSRKWRERVRPAKLRHDPLCQRCAFVGLTTPATEVDHQVQIAQGGDPWSDSNLTSLCRPCHIEKGEMDRQGMSPWPIAPSKPREFTIA